MTATTGTPATGELENPYAGQGSVLLDIGGDTGALVVTMPRAMVGSEVEIRPLGDGSPHDAEHHPHAPEHHHEHEHEAGHGHGHEHGHEHFVHVAVVERPVPGGTVPSLVFPDLRAGRYDLFEKGQPDAVALTVEVDGGAVTSVDWPG